MKPVAVPVAIPATCASVGNYEITCTWGEFAADSDQLMVDGFKYTVDNPWGGGALVKDGVGVTPDPESSVGMALALVFSMSLDSSNRVNTLGSTLAYAIPNTNKVIVQGVESCYVAVNTNNAFVVRMV